MAAIDKSLYEKMTITSVSGEKTADVKTGVISFNYYEDVFFNLLLLTDNNNFLLLTYHYY